MSLTGLRFLAAILIFLTHGANLFDLRDAALQKNYSFVSEPLGVIGVSSFFILSGFVLTWSARSGQTAPAFWRRRFFKIFPNHVTVWAVALILLVVGGAHFGLGPALTQLFLVQSWVPLQDLYLPPVNGITWSLSAELLFYAAFPLLIRGVRRIRTERLWLWVGIITVVALLLPVLAQGVLPAHPASLQSATVSWPRQWFLYFFPVSRSLEFIVGMVLAEVVRRDRWVGIGLTPSIALVLASYVASLALPGEWGFGQLYMLPTALFITALAVRDLQDRQTFLANRTWTFLGELTYSFFLIHVLVMFYLQAALVGQFGGTGYYTRQQYSTPVALAFLVLLFAVSLALSWVLYRTVQVPAARRWSKKRTPKLAVVPTRAGPDPAEQRAA
ncbi:MAG TPA: acyltransferase [Pseudonocardiaceae bacterium]|jgi:peptidoglycan/LPS O-acetylase OafA/YrhL|nr:acyltransferase [Pseudonocardiaceae bacterium]